MGSYIHKKTTQTGIICCLLGGCIWRCAGGHDDYMYFVSCQKKTNKKYSLSNHEVAQRYPWDFLVGCATQFPKFWPYFRPQNVFYHTCFYNWPLKSIPISSKNLQEVTGCIPSPVWNLWKPFTYCSIEENSLRDLTLSLKFEWWYSFYIADQDTARQSFCSAGENNLSTLSRIIKM